jgi:hypothetical protein
MNLIMKKVNNNIDILKIKLEKANEHFNNLMELYNKTILFYGNEESNEIKELDNLISLQMDRIRELNNYKDLSI